MHEIKQRSRVPASVDLERKLFSKCKMRYVLRTFEKD